MAARDIMATAGSMAIGSVSEKGKERLEIFRAEATLMIIVFPHPMIGQNMARDIFSHRVLWSSASLFACLYLYLWLRWDIQIRRGR